METDIKKILISEIKKQRTATPLTITLDGNKFNYSGGRDTIDGHLYRYTRKIRIGSYWDHNTFKTEEKQIILRREDLIKG